MPINSKRKGARGEREWARVLRGYSYNARRGRQYSGSPDSPDVVVQNTIVHWEVKCVEKLNLNKAMRQSTTDCDQDKLPAVAHKVNRGDWMVTMFADDLLPILKYYESKNL